MGEVYKARDTRLDRTVAIKVLPAHLSDTEELRERFEREARAISSLSHPNICTLHDIGRHEGIHFLVMEYLDGQTLAERLTKGPMPVDQALKLAIQIAGALDKAHRQGITHRDLKPGNIMVTKAGAKLLDFGLAKLKPTQPAVPDMSAMPTKASGDLTVRGTILGTLNYMSPEQLEGDEADARSDIFAFGAVLYEMLTGRKAFEGRSTSSVIAAILHVEPPEIRALQPVTPRSLERLVKICLAKDPGERWQSAHDLGLELQRISDSGSDEEKPVRSRRSKIWVAVPVAAILSITAIALTAIVTSSRKPASDTQIVKFDLNPPDKMTFDAAGGTGLVAPASGAISPDGSKFAFTAKDESGKATLWVRPLSAISAQMFPGTEGAAIPFWSPDNKFIAFFAQGKLKKIGAAGGPVQTICDAPGLRYGDWSKDGLIVFAPTPNSPIYRVPSSGGEVLQVTKLLPEQSSHRYPQFLPDGKHFIFFAMGNPGGVFAGSLDSPEGLHLVDADSPALYAPQGYLLFVRQGTLLAQPFDAGKIQLSGEPVPVAERVAYDGPARSFSVASNGTLTYRIGSGGLAAQLTWVDRAGKLIEASGEPGELVGPEPSPDGKRIAVQRRENKGGDLWLVETAGGKTSRLTFDATQENTWPVWSPDGSRIAFASRRAGKWGIYEKPSNQTGTDTLLFESDDLKWPTSWSQDGKFLLFVVISSKARGDIWKLPLTGDGKAVPILETQFNEMDPQISPNGKWIAYRSDETGRNEVYVQSFPTGSGKWQISSNGGVLPRWRRDGGELFYMDGRSGGNLLSSQTKTNGTAFEFSSPRVVYGAGFVVFNYGQAGSGNVYSVSADGQRFLMERQASNLTGAGASTPITIVLNWTALLPK
jgi:serine/threonine protein kinase